MGYRKGLEIRRNRKMGKRGVGIMIDFKELDFKEDNNDKIEWGGSSIQTMSKDDQ
jgi:hypothetical protein